MRSHDNFFIDIEKIRTIDTLRIIYFISFLIMFCITEFGRFVYRPFIYKNNLNDLGIADSIGNSGGIIVQILFGLTVFNPSKRKGIRLIIFFIMGYIVYESIQPLLPKGVFDWQDIYGTLIGGTIGLIIFLILIKALKQNKILIKF